MKRTLAALLLASAIPASAGTVTLMDASASTGASASVRSTAAGKP